MSKTRIIKFAFIVFLLCTSVVFAQTREMKEHKVTKGDTLWDIADAELKNAFLWPKIWKENTWIKNPDKIYPNQVIRIPLYLIKKEKLTKEAGRQDFAAYQEPVIGDSGKKAKSLKKQPLVDENTFIAAGYIADSIPQGGKISASPSGQSFFGIGDIIYADFDQPVAIRDKFYVVKTSKLLKHPVTGAKIGYVLSINGIAEIVKAKDGETKALITKCFREIEKGELLVPYYAMEIPRTTGQFRRPNINGMIIAAGKDCPYQSLLDIIYLDKGCRDGIAAGDMFRTIAVEGEQPEPNGIIQVLSCREHTATAIIKASSSPIVPGNIFADLDKN